MAFYDRFFDRLEDIYHEYESNRRTSSRRRYTDSSGTGYRYSGTERRKRQTGGDDDLSRYDGLYHAVKRRGDTDGEEESGRGASRRREDPEDGRPGIYPGEDGEDRSLNPLKRRRRVMEERARLAGAYRPGHVYDDIEDGGDDDYLYGGRRSGREDRSDEADDRLTGISRGRRGGADDHDDYDEYTDGGRGEYSHSEYSHSEYSHSARNRRAGFIGDREYRRREDRYDRDMYDDRRAGRRRDRYGARGDRYDDHYDDYYDDRYDDRYDEPVFRPPQKKRMSVAARFILVVLVSAFFIAQTVIFGSIMTKPRQYEDIPEVDYTYTDDSPDPRDPESMYTAQARQFVAVMSTEQKVGQLIVATSIGSEGGKLSDDDFCALVSATDATGVLLRQEDCSGRSKDGLMKFIDRLQQEGGGELFVMTEEEGGAKVSVSFNSALRSQSFRSAQAMYISGGLELISSDAAEKSEFLTGLGFNVNIAPLCDVVTGTGGFMYSRAYGKGAADTSEYVAEVTRRMKEKNIGCVLKYFPGYGNSKGDTRNGLIVIDTVATVIRERDLKPFKAGIDARADAVMVSHAIVTAIDDSNPASLSPAVISLLRDELGFDGVVMCEPLCDEGLAEHTGGEDVSVRALNAGIDLLLAPADAPAVKNAVTEAVINGTVPQERLDEAVCRILRWKIRLGIIKADG